MTITPIGSNLSTRVTESRNTTVLCGANSLLLFPVIVNSKSNILLPISERGEKVVARTEFGKAVKIKLIEIDKTQRWLMDQITEKTGLYIDDSYMHRILTGKYENEKVVECIKEILGI